MRIFIIILNVFLLISSCVDKTDYVQKPIHEGMFDGNIGRHLFVQTNSEYRIVISQKGNYDNLDVEINLDGSGGQGDHKFIIFNQLNIHLKDISKDKHYLDFDQNNGTNSANINKINLLIKEEIYESKLSKEYICLPNKKNFKIKINEIGDNNKKFIKATINGYLYNINNANDSILINAKFITE